MPYLAGVDAGSPREQGRCVRQILAWVVALVTAQATQPVRAQQPARAAAEKSYFEFAALQSAELIPGNPPPYPEALRSQGVRGEVTAQFVVDTLGHVVPGTFSALRSPHPLLTRAVRANLANLRFRPAVVEGHKVNQVLQHSFVFDPSDPTTMDSAVMAHNVTADTLAAATDDRTIIEGFGFVDEEELRTGLLHALRVRRRGHGDVVELRRSIPGGRDTTIATLPLPGKDGSERLVIRSCTLDGRSDPEVIGLVAIRADGHRVSGQPTRAWRASRIRRRFEALPPARVRCDDEDDVD